MSTHDKLDKQESNQEEPGRDEGLENAASGREDDLEQAPPASDASEAKSPDPQAGTRASARRAKSTETSETSLPAGARSWVAKGGSLEEYERRFQEASDRQAQSGYTIFFGPSNVGRKGRGKH